MKKREISKETKQRMHENRIKAKSERAKDAVWSSVVATLARYEVDVQNKATHNYFVNAQSLIERAIEKQLDIRPDLPVEFDEDSIDLN
jgi:hypothetical protein